MNLDFYEQKLKILQTKEKKSSGPRHEKGAIVSEILETIGENKLNEKYGFGFWLKMSEGWTYGEILAILKEIKKMPDNFNKGAILVNKLKNSKSKKSKKK
jgi:hypothetical protein